MLPTKYPRTPYWPSSPSIAPGDRTTPDSQAFLGVELVITEKLDGSNVLLHNGQVYARSTSGGPAASAPWLAMVRKHHAWRLGQLGYEHILLYGEDLYGVHAIEYDPMPENHTFRAFASIRSPGRFDSFSTTQQPAAEMEVAMVPILHQGAFQSTVELDTLLEHLYRQPSELGGPREGMVIRFADTFPVEEFPHRVCKYVRPDHVQKTRHWRTNWKPCRTTPPKGIN